LLDVARTLGKSGNYGNREGAVAHNHLGSDGWPASACRLRIDRRHRVRGASWRAVLDVTGLDHRSLFASAERSGSCMMGYTFRVQRTFALQAVWALLVLAVATPLTFWGVSLEEVWRIMREADWRPTALAVVLFVLTLAAKSARWQIFFEPGIRFSSILSALIIGVVVNFFL